MYFQRVDIEDFKYCLWSKEEFETGYDLGKWELFNPQGQLVARCNGSKVTVLPGYLWDGTTVIGYVYEDPVTMHASLIHDVLYNAHKNPDNVSVPFSLYTADKIFLDEFVRRKHRFVSLFELLVLSVVAEQESSRNIRTVAVDFTTKVNEYYVAEF